MQPILVRRASGPDADVASFARMVGGRSGIGVARWWPVHQFSRQHLQRGGGERRPVFRRGGKLEGLGGKLVGAFDGNGLCRAGRSRDSAPAQ